jgi:hypothetical protein
MDQSLSRE